LNARGKSLMLAAPPAAAIEARPSMTVARFPSLAHWGAFTALVENGRLVGCEPFARDPAPSNLIEAMPEMVHSPLRIARPAIREGWREGKPRSGADRFREVSWAEALDTVAGEVAGIRERHGATAILGGSYGWSSAGRVHHARSLLRRFLFLGGGCVDQAANYSFGAAMYLLPRVIGTFQPVVGEITDWSSVVKHTRLIIAFGGIATKNGQVTSGGAGAHTLEPWLRRARAAGIDFVSVSPLRSDIPAFVDAEWVAIRPNTDTALMLAMAHTLLIEERYDAEFMQRHCSGFDAFRRYLEGADDATPKSAAWAQAITGVHATSIVDLARRAAATRSLITCAWSLQRAHHGEQPYWAAIVLAAMLGGIGLPGGGFGFGHGSTNGIGEPRLDIPAPEVPLPLNPARTMIPVARIADMLLSPGRALRLQRPHLHLSRHPADLLGRRQPLSSPPGSKPAAPCLAEARDRHRARELVDADRAPRRYRPAGDHHARAQRYRRLLARSLRPRHAPRHRSRGRGEKRSRHLPGARGPARL
jgi:biotin/methionine sulfoxide reductase